jgi:hypothetical protein
VTTEPYCTGDRCADCEPPAATDVHGEEDCCEASCGYCPRVEAHGNCALYRGSDEGSHYCDQHGEGSLHPRSAEAELRYRVLRGA